MKKIIAVTVFLMMSIVSFAQDIPVPGKWAKKNTEQFVEFASKEWKLNEEQKSVVYDYRLDFIAKRAYINKQKKEGTLSQEEAKAQVQAAQKEVSQGVSKYLNIKVKEYYRVNKAFNESKSGK
ncbi:hypothetical protein [Flammeovirga sp. SJP92]|uniref:hypothetical protein n=1 Tax=Flammeovirga sp. SJP92 TaxID=1775430 RepID=UPI000787D92C|nr:hypothetical protein [Flammeovirga sp. SJP92]KXX69289.1 hypothetical protein AVL50_19925 [Flammeovirga sp. SJP92]